MSGFLGRLKAWGRDPANLFLLCLYLAFTAHSFYQIIPNSVNNSNFLPILSFAKNNASYQNDLMYLVTRYLFSFYYLIPQVLAPYVKAEYILFSTLALQNLLIFISVYVLVYELFKDRITSILSVVMIILLGLVRFSLATDVLFGSNLFPDLFALPLLLFAIYFFLRERYLLACFLTGVVFNFHGTQAVFIIVMFFTYFVFNREKVGFKTIAQSGGLFFLGAMPLLLLMISTPTQSGGRLPFNEWLRHIRVRRGHHCFPSKFNLKRWFNFLFIMLPISTAFFSCPREIKPKQKVLRYLGLGVFFLFFIGTVFTEFVPIPTVINLTLFRSSRFLIIIGVIFLCNYLARKLNNENPTVALAVIIVFYLLAMPNLYVMDPVYPNGFIFLVPATFFLVITSYLATRNQSGAKMRDWLLLFGLFAVTETAYLLLKRCFPLLRAVHQVRMLDIYVLLGAVSLFLIADFFVSLKKFHQWLKWGLLVALLSGHLAYQYYPRPRNRVDTVFLDAQKWLAQNAPPDNPVITPPYLRGFRSFSERGIVFSWFDSDDMAYVPHLGQDIMERFRDFGFSYDNNDNEKSDQDIWWILKKNYTLFDEADFLRIAKKYNARLAVVVAPKSLKFPLLYRNDLFAVYRVR